MLASIKAHPIITAVFVISTGLGGYLGLIYSPEEWSDGRKVAAGLITGLGCAAMVVATRMVGAFAHNIEDDGR